MFDAYFLWVVLGCALTSTVGYSFVLRAIGAKPDYHGICIEFILVYRPYKVILVYPVLEEILFRYIPYLVAGVEGMALMSFIWSLLHIPLGLGHYPENKVLQVFMAKIFLHTLPITILFITLFMYGGILLTILYHILHNMISYTVTELKCRIILSEPREDSLEINS